MSNEACPCGSNQDYSKCCEPYITGKVQAPTAEALMRSRYSAHVKVSVPYLKDTLAPESRGDFDEQDVRKWATKSEWLGLKIISAKEQGSKATVEFTATYKTEGKTLEHHEVAQFRKDANLARWYFVDGDAHVHEEGQGHNHDHHHVTAPIVREGPKIGRNDPCTCGSGKKYKKCCGQAA